MLHKQFLAFIMLSLCYEVGNSFDPCKDLQYLEMYETGIIQCSFDDGFVGIQWYDSTKEGTTPIITFVRSLKSGRGYMSGDYDIFPNGSLIVTNVTVQHDRVFSVVLAASEESSVTQYTIRVETVVTQHLYPTIEQCHEESNMCYSVDYPPSLNCFIRNVRPEALLTWSQRMVDYDSILKSELIVTPGKQNTFTSHASVNLTKSKPLLSVYTCKLTREVFHVAEYEAFIIVENTKFNLHRQPIKFNAELHSTLVLPCTAFKADVIVWKRSVFAGTAPQVIIVSVKNWKDDRNITYNEDFTLGTDGSLILERTDWHHSGIYTCVATNYNLADFQIIDVMIFVSPSPPYLTIEGCNYQQYCVLEVEKEGNITCSVYGIRPEVELQWSYYSQDTDGLVIKGEQRKSTQNANTFDISLTTNFIFSSTFKGRITIECITVGKYSDLFPFATKLDLLAIYGDENGFDLKHPSTIWIIAGSVITILVLFGILTFLCRVTMRSRRKKKNDNQRTEENMQMMDSVKATATSRGSKKVEDVIDAEKNMQMMDSVKATATSRGSKKVEDVIDAEKMMDSVKATATSRGSKKVEDVIDAEENMQMTDSAKATTTSRGSKKVEDVIDAEEIVPMLESESRDSDIKYNDEEVHKRHEELKKSIEAVEANTVIAEKLWKEKKRSLVQCREDVYAKINKDTMELIQRVEREKHDLMKKVDDKESSDITRSVRERKNINVLKFEVEQLKNKNYTSAVSLDDTLQELRNITKGIDRIKDIQLELDHQKETLKQNADDLLYRKIPNDGSFCSIKINTPVGE
ncbi:uncharacterized protein [Apostichopus japonicus]|uniref:uncharacterized protein isoform X2 n=1 Tax=Stichopus japonicus TaxID=307972 RepID=UPI003AB7738D